MCAVMKSTQPMSTMNTGWLRHLRDHIGERQQHGAVSASWAEVEAVRLEGIGIGLGDNFHLTAPRSSSLLSLDDPCWRTLPSTERDRRAS